LRERPSEAGDQGKGVCGEVAVRAGVGEIREAETGVGVESDIVDLE